MAVSDYLSGWAPEDYGAGLPGNLNVGAGIDWANLGLNAWDLAQRYGLGRQGLQQDWLTQLMQNAQGRQGLGAETYGMLQAGEQARMGLGQTLMGQLIDVQRDPFNIVTALQAYGQSPSATPLAADIAATGGQGRPSPYGNLVEQLMQGLAAFSQRGMPTPGDVGAYTPPAEDWLDAFRPGGESFATAQTGGLPGTAGGTTGGTVQRAGGMLGPVDPNHWMLQYGPGEYPADIQAKISAAENPAAKAAGYEHLRGVVGKIASGKAAKNLGMPQGARYGRLAWRHLGG